MIQLKNITKKYRTELIETSALTDINLEVQAGEFVSIMGPSGCGKSTLLNIIGLIDEPSSGQVMVNNQDVSSMGSRTLANLGTLLWDLFFRVFILFRN